MPESTPNVNISIEEFTDAIFGELPEGETVCYCRMSAAGKFRGRNKPYRDVQRDYFCVSSVEHSGDQFQRRRRRDARAAHCVVLDDVGTKVDEPRVEPSWKLETSRGNWQWGFIVERCEDLDYYEACLDGLADAGLTDPGAKGCTRVMRVPESLHNEEDGYRAELTLWAPERRWKLPALMEALGVTPGRVGRTREPMALPAGVEIADPVLGWLLEQGHLLGGERAGWFEVACPWGVLHTPEDRPSGSAYSPLGAGDHPDTRGFKCHHSHDHGAREFLDWVEAQGGPAAQVTETDTMLQAARDRLAEIVADMAGETAGNEEVAPAALPTLQDLDSAEIAQDGLPDLEVTGKGMPSKFQLPTQRNAAWILDRLGLRLRRNVMTNALEMEGVQPCDIDRAIMMLEDCAAKLGIRAPREMESRWVADAEEYHPMEEWLQSLKWDGEDRIEKLAASIETPQEDLLPVYLRKWLIQGVQAACGWRAPSQMAGVFVLSGKQGAEKNKWMKSIVPPQFYGADRALHLDTFDRKDHIAAATNRTIVELNELDSTFRKSEVSALKAFISSEEDAFRPPYGRKVVTHPRKTSFCGMVNGTSLLLDETGSRRFWPVEVIRITLKHGVDRDQLWAQAHFLWASGEQWWLDRDWEDARDRSSEDFQAPCPVAEKCDAVVAPWLEVGFTQKQSAAYTAGELAEVLGVHHPDRRTLRLVVAWMERKRVKRWSRKLGKRKCWVLPTPDLLNRGAPMTLIK